MTSRMVTLKLCLTAFATVLVILFLRVAPQRASAGLLAAVPTLHSAATPAEPQQYPIMDRVANKIIDKYQNSTCDQLWQERAQGQNKPKSPEEQKVIGVLHDDAQMRTAFINKIAAPIANKMFECGMIP